MATKDRTNEVMVALEKAINQALFLSGNAIKNNIKKRFKPAIVVGTTSGGKKKYAQPQPLDTIHERTTFLRKSIQASDVVNHSISVGTAMRYAAVNELGGANTPARPFIRPGTYDSIEEIKKIFLERLKTEVEVSVR